MEEEEIKKRLITLTLGDLKNIVTVNKDVCQNYTNQYEKCIKENKNNFKNCIDFYDFMIKCNFLSD